MPKKKWDFKLVEEGNQVRFEKRGYNFKEDTGMPILGWFRKGRFGTWLNYLRGLEMEFFDIVKKEKINPDHITLYDQDQGIWLGWIEKDYKDEIIQALWNYGKNGPDRVVEVEEETLEMKQMPLF